MSEWGWTPERNLGIWRHGAGWLKPVMAAIPCLTVGVLLLMLYFVGGTFSSAKGVLFDLPTGEFSDADAVEAVVLVMPVSHETMVFFDDSRYLLGDGASMRTFGESLSERMERSEKKTVLFLADRRISSGKLMELMSVARKSGAGKVLVAGKRGGDEE